MQGEYFTSKIVAWEWKMCLTLQYLLMNESIANKMSDVVYPYLLWNPCVPLKAGRGTQVNSYPIWEELGVLETTVESDRKEVKYYIQYPTHDCL